MLYINKLSVGLDTRALCYVYFVWKKKYCQRAATKSLTKCCWAFIKKATCSVFSKKLLNFETFHSEDDSHYFIFQKMVPSILARLRRFRNGHAEMSGKNVVFQKRIRVYLTSVFQYKSSAEWVFPNKFGPTHLKKTLHLCVIVQFAK